MRTLLFIFLLCVCPTFFLYSQTENTRLITIGGSLTFGLRDGFISKESQQSSYVGFLAKQLNIKDFKHPDIGSGLFEKLQLRVDERNDLFLNGGFFAANVEDESQKFRKVDLPVDNLAIPFQKVIALDLSYNQTENWLPLMGKESFSFLSKYLPEGKETDLSYSELVESQIENASFFTYELGFDDFLDYFRKGGLGQDLSFVYYDREGYYPENKILSGLKKKEAKGVVLNIPEVLLLPYFTYYRYDNHRYHDLWIEHYDKNDVRKIDKGDILLPTDVSWYYGLGNERDNPVLDENVISVNEIASVSNYNRMLEQLAKQNGFPIVDLNGLYKKIREGKFVIGDVIVDSKYPSGRFFSADGITPTELGHAIIANEIIATLNKYYKSSIPLVDLSKYL